MILFIYFSPWCLLSCSAFTYIDVPNRILFQLFERIYNLLTISRAARPAAAGMTQKQLRHRDNPAAELLL
ncbi:MAG: hypothetical protein IKQ87_06975 [Clostridia bacterium]|nr:hypothetical protein [Clostridia bacterium]